MAGSVNKVILVGNLGKDPEIRRTQDGRPIANLSVATSESWRDKTTGERKEKTEWHRVVIFSEGLCKIAEQYLKKGSKVYLEGQLADPQIHRQGRRREIFDRGGAAELQFGAHHARHAAAAVAAVSARTSGPTISARKPGAARASPRWRARPAASAATWTTKSRSDLLGSSGREVGEAPGLWPGVLVCGRSCL